jgi:GT2 family glycosyltransferase
MDRRGFLKHGDPMTINVIVATYNRAPLLEECLRHLARQSFEPRDEVIIVDNGSTDRTKEVICAARATFPVGLRLLDAPAPGKTRALARALEAASGDIIAFTDDDVNVDRSWLDAIRSAMRDRDLALVGGPVAPRWERPAPQWLNADRGPYTGLMAPLGLLNYGDRATPLGRRTLLGANLAVRREVLNQVGGFAADLGKVRGTLMSGEDREFCERVQASGFRAVYWPAARVTHWVPADRLRLGYFLAWFFWSGITNAMLDDSRPTRSITGVPLHLFRRFLTGLAGAAAAAVTCRREAAVERITDAAFAAGWAAKRWRLVTPNAALSSHAAGSVK